MPLSDYALDKFVAPKLSELTACGADKLAEPENLLSNFILNNIVVVRYVEPMRANAFNMIRRVDQASYEYEQGRDNLSKYLNTPPEVISPYFRALSHFEQCVAMLYQSALFAARLVDEKVLYKQGDGSFFERMNKLYTASKHMVERIEQGRIPVDATTGVWLTNDGIECEDASVNFAELREALIERQGMARYVAEELPKQVQETLRRDSPGQ